MKFRQTRRGPRGPNAAPVEVATSLALAIFPAVAGTHGFQIPLARFHCDNWQLVREISAIGEHLKADFCHAISVFL